MNRVLFRATAVVCLLAMLPFVAGCGVIFGGTRQVIRATSSPDGAFVTTAPPTTDYKTPTSLSLQRKLEYTLAFSMPGYSSQSVQLEKAMRVGILIADVLLTGIIGVIVDATTGGWYKLSPEVVNVTLMKVDAGVVGPDTITVTVSVKPTKDGADVRVDSTVPGVWVEAK